MNIVVKRSGEYPDGRDGWFTGSVGLNEGDLLQLVYEGKVPGYKLESFFEAGTPEVPRVVDEGGEPMTVSVKFKTLRRAAELMMILWFADEGLISPEEAKRQAQALG